MNTRSLKFRLVTWYAGWLTVLFIVFGVFVYLSLSHYLEKSLREALVRRARQVADTVQRSSLEWNALGQEIQNHFAPEANNRFTRVTFGGAVKYTSGFPNDRSFIPDKVPSAPVTDREETFEQRSVPDGPVLLMVMVSRTMKGAHVVVEEGHSLEPMRSTLHAWLVMLVFGFVLLILVAVLGGFVLVQRALKPVDYIIRTAEQISSRNLSERLPVPQTRDELERLSIALNNMIRRLEDAFQHTHRFLADASHELRTPLTIIQGELENIAGKPFERNDVREVAGSALEEVERLKNIVEGLFALSRLDAGEAQEHSAPFDLGELAATTADQMCLLAEDKQIAIVCHCEQPVIVQGDRSRLKQVMVNLLDNAIKYTNSGGKIDVIITTRNGHAILEVADNGIGISTEAMPHLFQRFYRADKARSRELGGAGLGLSIVKSICAAHNGRVEAQSQQGVGSRFIVELPRAEQAVAL